MKGLALLTLVLAAAVVWFAVRAPAAFDAAAQARARLRARVAAFERLERTLAVASDADAALLLTERNQMEQRNERAFESILDATLGPPPPSLEASLAAAPFAALDPGARLVEGLREQAAASPQAGRALTKIAALLGRHAVLPRGITVLDEGRLHPVAELPRLAELEVELSLEGTIPALLDVLEGLAPGDGEPVLSVRLAWLQRVEPDRWTRELAALGGPPARLYARVGAAFSTEPQP